jgi:integrase
MPITDVSARKAKPKEKPYKLADGGGMYLEIMPNGSKYWRLKYRFEGKEKRLALGVYPDVPLTLARQRCGEARKLLSQGIDPSAQKKAVKAAGDEATANSFEVIAREWVGKHAINWTAGHSDKIIQRFERDIFPWMGNRPVSGVEPPELLAVLRRIEVRGALETAHRALSDVARVFAYAVATGRAQRNPAHDLKGALPPYKKDNHFAAITDPAKIGELMRAIAGYSGSLATRCALQLSPYVFLRPGEIRQAQWCEIDLDAGLWTIPAERMKMREPHLVPLSPQAAAILREIQPLTGHGRYVFPGERDRDRPMSDNAVRSALRRLG